MNKQIKAGADIHAGDGGYGIGTRENYDSFVKVRNYPLSKARITIELTRAQAELLHEVVEQDILRVEGRDMDGKQMILQRLYSISAKLDDELEAK